MGVDKETKLSYFNILIDTNSKYIKSLKDASIERDMNYDSDNKKRVNMVICDEKHIFQTEEYYFDEENNEIHISGQMVSESGDTNLYLTIPLSDTVLIDILQHSIKKLNKLKSVLESLK